MNKAQTDILIDIIALGIIMALCFIAISQIPAMQPTIGYTVIGVLSLCVVGIIVTSGLIYACIKDLNDTREDDKNE